MDAVALERVSEAFQGFHDYFAPDFGRREAREHSRHYLRALLVQSEERRNAENLSETVPASPRALQRFLAESPWLDFTQNLEEATDAITLGRPHSWLASEGFSLSTANADVQELPATLCH